MKQRIFALILILTVTATVIFPVAVTRVSANTPADSDVITFDDFWDDHISSITYFSDTNKTNFYNFVKPLVENTISNEKFLVSCCYYGNKCAISVFEFPSSDMYYVYKRQQNGSYYYNYYGISYDTSFHWNSGDHIKLRAYLYYNGSYGGISRSPSSVLTPKDSYYSTNSWNFDTYFVPNYFSYNTTDFYVFNSRPIQPSSSWETSSGRNLLYSDSEIIINFNMLKFNIGDRWYMCPSDLNLLHNMQRLSDTYLLWYIVYSTVNGDEYSYAEWDDLIEVPSYYFPSNVSNLHSGSDLCIEITEYMGGEYTTGCIYSEFWNVFQNSDGEEIIGDTIARWIGELSFILAPDEKDISYNETINNWYTYVSNYPTNSIIPSQLAQQIYGVNGTKLYPCSVQVPSMLFDPNDSRLPQTTSGIRYFRWYFEPEINNPALNYDLMDVCILNIENPGALTGEYEWDLWYFYDSTLNYPRSYLLDCGLPFILENFDIILLVVSSQNGQSYTNAPFVENGEGRAWCGSGAEGIIFQDFETNFNKFPAYAIVTKKALQKQMLFNFNDSITKSYKLMSDYIEKRDLWDNSFLEWTTTLFTEWQSLDGRLSSIYNLLYNWNLGSWLSDISSKLDSLIQNTQDQDYSDINPWYLSLWNFITNFNPSDNDFSAALNQFDNNWDNVPDLPAPSTIPLLPESTPVPLLSGGG